MGTHSRLIIPVKKLMSIKFKVFMFALILQATELLKLTHPFLMAIIKPCVLLLSLNDNMVFYFAFNVTVPIKQIMLVNVKLNFHSPNGYSLCLGQPPYQHFVVNKLMWNLPVEFFSENVWVGFQCLVFAICSVWHFQPTICSCIPWSSARSQNFVPQG